MAAAETKQLKRFDALLFCLSLYAVIRLNAVMPKEGARKITGQLENYV